MYGPGNGGLRLLLSLQLGGALATGRSSLIFVHRCLVQPCLFLDHISYILLHLTLPVLDAAASAPLCLPRHLYMYRSIPRSRPAIELDETVGHLCGIGVLSDMGQEASIRTGGTDRVLADSLWERDGVRDRHPRQGELSVKAWYEDH